MKKTTLLFALLSFCLATFSQNGFQLGFKVAPNLSWIKPNSDNLENDGTKLGFNFGLMGDFNFADNYAFSTGITVTSIGGKVVRPDIQEFNDNNGNLAVGYGKTTADIRLKYIEVPLTLKLKTNEIGYMKYYGQFGFGLGFNYDASADEEFKYTTTNNNTGATLSNDEVDYKDEINALRASLIVGLGAEYNLSGNTSLVFGVTFNNGFTNIFSEDTYKADGEGNAISPTLSNGNPNGEYTGKRDQEAKAINNFVLLNIGVLF